MLDEISVMVLLSLTETASSRSVVWGRSWRRFRASMGVDSWPAPACIQIIAMSCMRQKTKQEDYVISTCKTKNGNEEENVKEMSHFFFCFGYSFFSLLVCWVSFLRHMRSCYKRSFLKEYRGRIKIHGHVLLSRKKKWKEKATVLHSHCGSLVELCCMFWNFIYKSDAVNTDMNNNARWNADIVLF